MDAWRLEFINWMTDKEEAKIQTQFFLQNYLPRLPLEVKELILRKVWRGRYKRALPFGLVMPLGNLKKL